MESVTMRFAAVVRELGQECRRHRLVMPGFRSPPRLHGVDRSLRRRADGSLTVAVVLRGRPWAAVLADMIEGIVVANGLDGGEAIRVRSQLWAVVGSSDAQAA
jgi:hypothetical protein